MGRSVKKTQYTLWLWMVKPWKRKDYAMAFLALETLSGSHCKNFIRARGIYAY